MEKSSNALVLAGAVAKGGFEAGAIRTLVSEAGLSFTRLVGTSAGALNASLLAAGVHAGTAARSAEHLIGLWRDRATWRAVLSPSPEDLIHGRGVSDQDGLRDILHDYLEPAKGTGADLTLRIIVTALQGVPGEISRPGDATTFEGVRTFGNRDFSTRRGIRAVIEAALASAAFPGVFAPVTLPLPAGRRKHQPCLDGGVVNNTPIKHALGASRVFVIVPFPATPPPAAAGLAWVWHLMDLLIHERLYRDLREAHDVNDQLAALRGLPPRVRADVLRRLGWSRRLPLEIVTIRPEKHLPGNPFSALSSQTLREEYIESGAAAARAALRARRILQRS